MSKLPKITGETVKGYVEWLKAEDCGCCHFKVGDTENNEIDIVVGWHNFGDGPKEKNYDNWGVAWKIGMQSFANAMQCDMDIDFLMPYDTESGEVYDTLEAIGEGVNYDALAKVMNETAEKVYRFQYDIEQKELDKERKYAA